MDYRRDIDGLRAIAVCAVILFHGNVSYMGGGFLGVDIFFVISGFLITGIIADELDGDHFSFGRFYGRRARRILPALLTVLLTCIPFAIYLTMPTQLVAFAKSAIAAVFFSSNIIFWRESGYFDSATELKPLLHTWSLALEEQFYLFFPPLLILLWKVKARTRIAVLLGLGLISLLLSEWGWRHSASANFFLLPSRVWEFVAGSLCAFAPRPLCNARPFLADIGMVAVFASIATFDQAVPVPSLFLGVPVIGTMLILLFPNERSLARQILSTKLLVGIGLLSYSAYLWHQPLFAFYRLYAGSAISGGVIWVLILVTFGLAFLSWYFVEQPFRRTSGLSVIPNRVFYPAAVATVLLVVGLCSAPLVTAGNPLGWFDNNSVAYFQAMADEGVTWRNKRRLRLKPFPDNGAPNVLVVGDSMSGDLLNALVAHYGSRINYSSATIWAGCGNLYSGPNGLAAPEAQGKVICRSSDGYGPETLNLIRNADLVFLASYWRPFEVDRLGESIRKLIKEFGPKFRVVGFKTTSFSERNIVSRPYEKLAGLSLSPARDKSELNNRLAKAAGIWFVDMYSILCPRGKCPIVDDEMRPIFFERSHLTEHGAEVLGEAIGKTGLLNHILRPPMN